MYELIERHLPDAHAYADDTQLYISFRADYRIDQETAVRTVEMCTDDIKRWMLTNKLKLNEGKTEVILIGTRQQLEKIDFKDICVGSNVVTCVETAKNLDCWFDSHMKMDTHVILNVAKLPSFTFITLDALGSSSISIQLRFLCRLSL